MARSSRSSRSSTGRAGASRRQQPATWPPAWYPFAVPQQSLDNLKDYKYSAMDLSPISKYIMQPYWTWATTLFPMWIAPNLITLLGFLFVIVNVGLVLFFTPDLGTGGPSWIYFSMALGIWLYSTFDNVDGKQARRTRSSSPLGELFDHGVDALNCTFGGILQAAGAGTGLGWYFTYYTGCLYLGYLNGPTEGLLIAVASLILSGIYGPQLWSQTIGETLPFLPVTHGMGQIKLVELVIAGMFTLMVSTQIPVSVNRTIEACKAKGYNVMDALINTLPFIAAQLFVFVWITAPGSTALSSHAILLVVTFGISFGRIAAMIVLAHVTHTDYPTYLFVVVPYAGGALLARVPQLFGTTVDPVTEANYLYLIFTVITLDYTLWVLTVIHQFCTHLGIKCLTIPYPPPEPLSLEQLDSTPSTPRSAAASPAVVRKRKSAAAIKAANAAAKATPVASPAAARKANGANGANGTNGHATNGHSEPVSPRRSARLQSTKT
ncbi:CDP-alcohol phosphatidyltransferase-domain-containing protein [Entophlyctis helioformis]|nr:CDP-alcohol phosphatidyltransferase-domain-containing protein [Entophlyctis helioformis]